MLFVLSARILMRTRFYRVLEIFNYWARLRDEDDRVDESVTRPEVGAFAGAHKCTFSILIR